MASKTKASAKNVSSKGESGGIIFTENAIVITLNAADKRKAQNCLKKSGKITFSVREHSVTKLPQILDNGKLID
jgi:hypothetical protein